MSRVGRAAGSVVIAAIVFPCFVSPSAHAGFLTPKEALIGVFSGEPTQLSWFSDAPKVQLLVPALLHRIAVVKAVFGELVAVDEQASHSVIHLRRGAVEARLSLDHAGLVAGLFLSGEVFSLPEDAVRAIDTLPGRTSLAIFEDGRMRLAARPNVALAVGSAFKLAVLAALRSQVESGRRSWRDVIALQPEDKTLASGILQDWPDGTPLTVQTLATLMISISDNSAADALIRVMGRDAVSPFAPQNHPFLSTREALVLKDPRNVDLLERYRRGNAKARSAVLVETTARPLPSAAIFETGPRALGVEWFLSTRELCALMGRVADLRLMTVNPGPIESREWQRVAYKGGSEPGVMNETVFLQDDDGRTHCVSATWNSERPLEGARLKMIVRALARTLHR